ncbi:IclR family transcriptional regulator [Pigmentiphaga soli]|uniref:IclR family transcriptional regulator n=1 Tax=Pigmentiphaga soli TaxID=1007095 RepID=A0ABP8H0I5_9BURK
MRPGGDAPAANAAAGTQTVQRAFTLLRIITKNNSLGSRLVDLYTRSGLERPTVHRILQGMLAEQVVRQDRQSKRYYLGPLIYEMGLAAAPKAALRDIVHPYMKSLARYTGDTVFMTVRSGFDGVCVARAEGAFPLKVHMIEVGLHRPLNVGAGGLALLSALPDDEIRRVAQVNVERTRKKDPSFSASVLRANVAATRRRGFAVNKALDTPRVMAVGVAARYPDATPALGLSISTLASRFSKGWQDMAVRCLKEAVQSIEADLARQDEGG